MTTPCKLYRIGVDLVPVLVGQFPSPAAAGAAAYLADVDEENTAFLLLSRGALHYYCSLPDGYAWETSSSLVKEKAR
jgi:hypothetical protein